MSASNFWMVVGEGVPKYKHTTLMSARIEAERLAKLHRGQQFTIVKSVATCVSSDVQWVSNDPELVTPEELQSLPF